jgi:hypothetical protein
LSDCCPSDISWDSLRRLSVVFPVAGFVAQLPIRNAPSARRRTTLKKKAFWRELAAARIAG